jgi:hypothetical protein
MNLVWFILGISFYMVFAPILDQIGSLICTMIESAKSSFTLNIVESNKKAELIQQELEKPYEVSHAIGFEVPTYDEYYDDYEEDE